MLFRIRHVGGVKIVEMPCCRCKREAKVEV